jgi:hypothetical protein
MNGLFQILFGTKFEVVQCLGMGHFEYLSETVDPSRVIMGNVGSISDELMFEMRGKARRVKVQQFCNTESTSGRLSTTTEVE